MADLEHDTPADRRPYADAAPTYWQAGWRGILPIPAHSKKIRVTGWTGNDGAWPSYPDLQAWSDGPEGDGNIALRLPPGVIGIDVDHYDGKPGGAVFNQLQQQHGTLPATWRTTSRDDGISGIRLYRIPEGLRWPGILGPGIETVRTGHRYAMVWPSVHPNGGTYRWINPNGQTAIGDVPPIDDLPALPAAWVEALTRGEQATDQHRAGLNPAAANAWLTNLPGANTHPCKRIDHALHQGLTGLHTAQSRHDATLTLTNRLIWLAGEGHHGITPALDTTQAAFLTAVAGDRDPHEAQAEWDRMIAGAIDLAAAAFPTTDPTDPCDAPFAGLIPPRKDTPPCTTTASAPPQNGHSSASPTPSTTYETSSPTPPNANNSQPTTPAPTDSTAPSEPGTDNPEQPPASWGPVDLTAYLDGTYQAPQPTIFARTDNHHLLYPGLVHSFHGESESGKSFIVQAEAVRLLQAGRPVLFVDFESDPGSIAERLLLLGATPQQITDHFDYRNPDLRPNATPAELEAWTDMLAATYDLAVIDGVTDALGLFGYSTKENDDIASWMRLVPRNIATQTGAAVIIIDHVTKDSDTRGRFAIGGQAKMSGLTGAAYSVEVNRPLGRGLKGLIILKVAKDRPGYVRGISGPMDKNRMQEAARITVDSTNGKTPQITVDPPLQAAHADGTPPDPTRFTGYMEKASKLLEKADGELSGRQIREMLGGNKDRIAKALSTLVDEDYVTVRPGTGNAILHTIVTPYRQHDDPKSDLYQGVADLIPTPTGPSGPERPPRGPEGRSRRAAPATCPPTGQGPLLRATQDTPETTSGPHPEPTFCKHCGTDITEDLQFAPALVKCRHCRHHINGSERP